MIPTLLISGLIVGFLPGRWALGGVAIAAIAWGAILAGTGTVSGIDGVFGAVLLGLVNALVGASVSQSIRYGVRVVRRARASSHK